MALKFATYAENLRHAIKSTDNPFGREFGIREFAVNVAGISYEHVRKATKGESWLGEETNAAICELLGLPANEMLQLARKEKIGKTLGFEPVKPVDPLAEALFNKWDQLSLGQKEALVRLGNTFTEVEAKVA